MKLRNRFAFIILITLVVLGGVGCTGGKEKEMGLAQLEEEKTEIEQKLEEVKKLQEEKTVTGKIIEKSLEVKNRHTKTIYFITVLHESGGREVFRVDLLDYQYLVINDIITFGRVSNEYDNLEEIKLLESGVEY